ncbi:hypothetical protein SNEBB_003659 [Seison nebaliae]|nr:hypothetical protein SNEBB_003659 [Seison nebaliae]
MNLFRQTIFKNIEKIENILKEKEYLNILAIESSYDDSAIAALKVNRKDSIIISHHKLNQSKIHTKRGGVIANTAVEFHRKHLHEIFSKEYKEFEPDIIGVTNRPGLDPCLWEGIRFGLNLCKEMNNFFMPIHHMESHLLLPMLLNKNGGHCMIVWCEDINNYSILGTTTDISPGVCLDKICRRVLSQVKVKGNWRFNGNKSFGELLEFIASHNVVEENIGIKLSDKGDFDFQFSGVLRQFEDLIDSYKTLTSIDAELICFKAQEIIAKYLQMKLCRSLEFIRYKNNYRNNLQYSILMGGGVTANKLIREKLLDVAKYYEVELNTVPIEYCTDNALMIAWTTWKQIEYLMDNKKNLEGILDNETVSFTVPIHSEDISHTNEKEIFVHRKAKHRFSELTETVSHRILGMLSANPKCQLGRRMNQSDMNLSLRIPKIFRIKG